MLRGVKSRSHRAKGKVLFCSLWDTTCKNAFVLTSLFPVRGDDLQRPLAPRAALTHQTDFSTAMAASYNEEGLFRREQQGQVRGSCSRVCGFGVVGYFDAGADE
jgi:phosphoheptose isomerase